MNQLLFTVSTSALTGRSAKIPHVVYVLVAADNADDALKQAQNLDSRFCGKASHAKVRVYRERVGVVRYHELPTN